MAKQESGALFEESSQGAVSAVTAFVFLLSIALTLGGFVIMSFGVNIELGQAELWTFAAGLVATVLGFVIPFTLLPAIGK